MIGAVVAAVRLLIRSRRCQRFALVALAVLVTTVALFYLEEDWRGKYAWEKCRVELEARGMVLDWNKYIPPAVPNDQNFFMASTNILIRFKKAQTDPENEMAKSNPWLQITFDLPAFTTTKTNPLKVATILVAPVGNSQVHSGPDHAVIKLGAADAPAQMEAMLQKTVGRSAVGAIGIKLSEFQLGQLTPARISIQSETTPGITAPKPQNPKTPKPQNPKTPKPQNPKYLHC